MKDKPEQVSTQLTTDDLYNMAKKMQPFLEQGLSIKKSAIFAHVAHATVYKYYASNTDFADQINEYMSFKSKLITDITRWRLQHINKNVKRLGELEREIEEDPDKESVNQSKIRILMPAKEDWEFIEWVGANDKAVREEFGKHTEVTGKDGAPLIAPTALDEERANDIVTKIVDQIATMKGAADGLAENTDTTGGDDSGAVSTSASSVS